MKNNIGVILLLLIVCSCSSDDQAPVNNPFTIDLSRVSAINSKTEFSISIETLNGELITNIDQVSFSKSYKLVIESQIPAFYRIGLKGNFEIVENLNDPSQPATTSKYIIRIVEEVANGIPVGVIVLHDLNDKFYKESPARSVLLDSN